MTWDAGEPHPDSTRIVIITMIRESREGGRRARVNDEAVDGDNDGNIDERIYCSRLRGVSRFTNSATQLSRLFRSYFRDPEHESGCVTRENQRYLSLVVPLSSLVVVVVVVVVIRKRGTRDCWLQLNCRLSKRLGRERERNRTHTRVHFYQCVD